MKIKKLTDREHIVLRPSMYIGSVSLESHNNLIFENIFEEPKATQKDLTYSPGLIKIINEVIDNSVDAIIKTGKGSTIKVEIADDFVKVQDDSTGFPLPTSKNIEEFPVVLALGNARAGSNFNDEENQGQMGTNGVGAFATNCFSKKFEVSTVNSNIEIKANWHDNAILQKVQQSETNSKSGTIVKFFPDLEKFNNSKLDTNVLDVIGSRLVMLNLVYPEIKFSLNNKRIKIPKRLDALFARDDTPYVSHKSGSYEVLIIANNEKQPNFSVVNGLFTPDGGSHIDLILSDIVKALTEARGMKCTRADVLNTLQVVFVGKAWKNLRFNSQTKEKITNSTKETREYLGDLESLVTKVQKSKQIKDFIKAASQARELRADKNKIKEIKKTKIKSDKFLDAQGERKTLFIVEGDSAMGGLVPCLGRKNQCFYALKGKPLNAYKSSSQKMVANKELSELLAIIHQSDFEKVVISSDQDLDGMHIRGLLLGFFVKFLPELKDKIYFLQTPVRGAMKNGKLVRWSYDLEGEFAIKSGETPIYFKGLGTLEPEDLSIVLKTDPIEKIIQKVELSETDLPEILEAWLGDDSGSRKDRIIQNNFSIAKI